MAVGELKYEKGIDSRTSEPIIWSMKNTSSIRYFWATVTKHFPISYVKMLTPGSQVVVGQVSKSVYVIISNGSHRFENVEFCTEHLKSKKVAGSLCYTHEPRTGAPTADAFKFKGRVFATCPDGCCGEEEGGELAKTEFDTAEELETWMEAQKREFVRPFTSFIGHGPGYYSYDRREQDGKFRL